MCFCAANKTNCFFFLFISGVSVFGWFCITLTEICYVMPSVSKKSLIFQPETIFCSQISALCCFFLSRLLIAFLLSFDEIRQQKMYRYNDVLCAAFLDFIDLVVFAHAIRSFAADSNQKQKPGIFFSLSNEQKKSQSSFVLCCFFFCFSCRQNICIYLYTVTIYDVK